MQVDSYTKDGKQIAAAKPNFIVESRLRFKNDIHAHRLFLAMLYKANDGADLNEPIEIDPAFITGEGLSSGRAYSAVRTAIRNVLGEVVELAPKDASSGIDFTHLVRRAKLRTKADGGEVAKVLVQFESDIVPYIEAMFNEGKYTKVFLKYSMPLRSVYSLRIYELLCQYRGFRKTREIELDELRRALDIPDGKFKQWAHIRQKVIAPAQKHLQDFTDIRFEYSVQRRGRKVVGVCFEIFQNTPRKPLDSLQMDLFESLPEEEKPRTGTPRHVAIVEEYLWDSTREEALKKFSPERIFYYHAYTMRAQSQGRIKSSEKGFFKKALFEDTDNFEAQKAKRVERERANLEREKKQKEQDEENEKAYIEAEARFDRLPPDEQQALIDQAPDLPTAYLRKSWAIGRKYLGKRD